MSLPTLTLCCKHNFRATIATFWMLRSRTAAINISRDLYGERKFHSYIFQSRKRNVSKQLGTVSVITLPGSIYLFFKLINFDASNYSQREKQGYGINRRSTRCEESMRIKINAGRKTMESQKWANESVPRRIWKVTMVFIKNFNNLWQKGYTKKMHLF